MPYVPAGNVNFHAPSEPVNVDSVKPQLFTATVTPTSGLPLIELITDPKIDLGGLAEKTFCGTATSAATKSRHMHSLNCIRCDMMTQVDARKPINNDCYEISPCHTISCEFSLLGQFVTRRVHGTLRVY